MSSLRRALLALAALATLAGVGAAALILTSEHESSRGLAAALILSAAWGFAFTGLYAWDRRPGNNIGPLMTAIGFAWFFVAMTFSDNEVIFSIGIVGNTLAYAILIHLLLCFPDGKLEGRLNKCVVGLTYFVTTVLQALRFWFTVPANDGCDGCPENPVLIAGHEGLSNAINLVQVTMAIALIAITVVVVFRRWRRSDASRRRALSPVVFTGGLAFLILLVQLAIQPGVSKAVERVTYIAAVVVFACLPFAFLLGLLRSRIGKAEEITTALSAENEQLNAELQAKVEELRASRARARIVEAGYAERRRVERNLHDGAQQRLMALTMNLRLARDRLAEDPAATGELLDEAMEELGAATAELRELARGIHPVLLSERGLRAALGGLAERSPVPVELVATPAERLPAPIEMAAYFVVAEALTNVARYAEAGVATVRVERRDGAVEVEIRDDGVGGARIDAGTGLRGLEDRVGALEGRFGVSSRAGEGTIVKASIPCE
ncbi:MAG TPA: histidine kinase [Solirubrobacterales bacterium]|nr:histidine kinase [Solirubrobacterales bacterium]